MQADEFPSSPFTCADAKRLGINRKLLEQAQRDRIVRRVLHGVYVRAEVSDCLDLRIRAASCALGEHAVLCDRTAAWVWGVDAHPFRALDVPPCVESFVLRGHDPTERPECAGGSRDLRPEDYVSIGGVRVTTPLRTALDLGCRLLPRHAIAAMDALARLHAFTRNDLDTQLPRYFRRRGVVQLRQLVPLVDPRAESLRESWVRYEICRRDLPVPELQHWVRHEGVPLYRLDLAYPHARVAVEYDGEEFHTSTEARERDLARRQWLRERGWTVIVLTKDSFADEDAVQCWVKELRRALGILPR